MFDTDSDSDDFQCPKRKSRTTSQKKHIPILWEILTTGKCFLMRKSEKKGPNFWGPMLPILRLTFLELFCNFRQFGLKKWWVFLLIGRVFRTHVCRNTQLKVIPFIISLMIHGVSELVLPSFSTKKKIEVAAVFNISWFWPFLSWPFLDWWHSEEKPH